jgi:hypothetical protein
MLSRVIISARYRNKSRLCPWRYVKTGSKGWQFVLELSENECLKKRMGMLIIHYSRFRRTVNL